jgi:hypothetical protein
MPRVSREDRLERSLTDRLQAMIEDPGTPAYVVHRCTATLATILRVRNKRLAEKAKASAARKAERDQTERASLYVSCLPDNGRLVR